MSCVQATSVAPIGVSLSAAAFRAERGISRESSQPFFIP